MCRILQIKTEALERAAYVVAIVGFPLLLVSTVVAIWQIRETKLIVSSQNNIALNAMIFDNDRNSAIVDTIESGDKILKENGGKFADSQLDSYLGDYEIVFQASKEGYLSEEELCVTFSYYIAAIFKDKEVIDFMNRKNNADYFAGLYALNDKIKQSKNENCH